MQIRIARVVERHFTGLSIGAWATVQTTSPLSSKNYSAGWPGTGSDRSISFIQSTSLTVRRGRVRSLFRFEIGPSFKVGNKPRLLRLPSQLLLS